MTRFGSPSEPDAIARVEKAVSAAVGRIERVFAGVESQYPRAVGSQKTAPDDEFEEFVASVADNPQGVADLVTGWRGQFGDGEALSMLASYIDRNEKRLGRVGGETHPAEAGGV